MRSSFFLFMLVLGMCSSASTAVGQAKMGNDPSAKTADVSQAPSTSIKTEYLMTVYFPLEPSLVVNDQLRITNIRSEGGWVEGPRIKAKVIPPSGDWPRVTPTGQVRLDVRVTLQTEDKELIFMSYGGVVELTKDINDRLAKGETLAAGDCYWITAPTFQTKSEKYGWLNGIQAVGKMVSLKRATHVKYDIFAVK